MQELLLEAPNYRGFLSSFLAQKQKINPRFGYAWLARRAGFASRNFPRDLIQGQKRLTLSSLPKLLLALDLNKTQSRYFTLLAALDHPELTPEIKSPEKIRGELERCRQKMLRPSKARSTYFPIENWPRVYASLGSREQGASLEKILERSGLNEKEALTILEKLISQGTVKESKPRHYHATDRHLSFPEQTARGAFQNFFLRALAEASVQARNDFTSTEKLFYLNHFSVRESQIPKLLASLNETMQDFVESSEVEEGDRIVTLSCSLC